VRRALGPVDVTATISGPGGSSRTVTAIRATEVPPGERYGDAPGVFYKRVRVETPANWASPTQTPRHATPGDTVAVTIRAGGLQQRFSYRVEAVPEGTASQKRALVIAAEDYTGTSPNREAGYDGAPRYLAQHVDALEYRLDGRRRGRVTRRWPTVGWNEWSPDGRTLAYERIDTERGIEEIRLVDRGRRRDRRLVAGHLPR
jgi:hypothetical protein